MCFAELAVELKSFAGCRFRFWETLLRRSKAPGKQEVIAIRNSRIGRRIIWIQRNCLLEVIERFFETLLCPLVPKIAPSQI